jgi:hypothetical protein
MDEKLQLQEPSWTQAACQVTPTKGGIEENTSQFEPDPEGPSTEAEETTEILLWVRSLRYDSPVRALALEVLAGKPPSTIQPSLVRLADSAPNRWKECAVAAWVLGQSTSLDVEQRRTVTQRLCQILGKQELQIRKPLGERFRRRLVQSLPAIGGFGLLIDIYSLVWCIRNHQTMEQGLRFVLASILGILVFAIPFSPISLALSIAYDRKRIDRVRSAAAEALGNLKSAESLDLLATSATGGSRTVRRAAREALCKVLPTVTQAQYGRLATETIPCLCSVLRDTEEPLALAILNALRLIGGANAIPTVTRLVMRGQTEKVRQAATLLLPLLQQRREEENIPAVLLRASQASPSSPGILLRSTIGPSKMGEHQLLRAGSGSEETRQVQLQE